MYTTLSRISVPVSVDELEALRCAAARDMRDPRDQARFILRRGLGLLRDQGSEQATIGEQQEEIQR